MSVEHDYADVFGEQENRRTRGRLLAGILGLQGVVDETAAFRDAWVEKWQNPDRASGVGPLIIAFYLELGVGPAARRGATAGIFVLRNHPLYRAERDDTVALGYSVFYFAAPVDRLSEGNLASLMRGAVEPVDTDARWAGALAVIHEEEAEDADDRRP